MVKIEPYDDGKQRVYGVREGWRSWLQPFADQLRRLPVLGVVFLSRAVDAANASKSQMNSSLSRASPAPLPVLQDSSVNTDGGGLSTLELIAAAGVPALGLSVFVCCCVLKNRADTRTQRIEDTTQKLNNDLHELNRLKGTIPHSIDYAARDARGALIERLGLMSTSERLCKLENQSYFMGVVSVLSTLLSVSPAYGIKKRYGALDDLKNARRRGKNARMFESFVIATIDRSSDICKITEGGDLVKMVDVLGRNFLHIAALSHNAEVVNHLRALRNIDGTDRYEIHSRCNGDNTPLHLALKARDKTYSEKHAFIAATRRSGEVTQHAKFDDTYNSVTDSDRKTPNDLFQRLIRENAGMVL